MSLDNLFSMVSLRPATPADLPALYQLDLLCFTKPFRFSLRTMRHYAAQPNAILPVAEQAGMLVGFLLINLEQHRGYITTLDVHPAHRRQGIAHRLLEAAQSQALKANVTGLTLHVSAGNEPAICFYQRAGFIRQSLDEHFYAPNLHAWLYTKPLIQNELQAAEK